MDELTLDQKQYVSAKRAAYFSGYTTDYIGQLCRAGELSAQKVGRNWYIEKEALQTHRKTYQGEPVVDKSEWEVAEFSQDTERPYYDMALRYSNEEGRRQKERLADEMFSLRYETESAPLVPEPIKRKNPLTEEQLGKEGLVPTEERVPADRAVVTSKDPSGADRESSQVTQVTRPSAHILSLKAFSLHAKRAQMKQQNVTHNTVKKSEKEKQLPPKNADPQAPLLHSKQILVTYKLASLTLGVALVVIVSLGVLLESYSEYARIDNVLEQVRNGVGPSDLDGLAEKLINRFTATTAFLE